MGALYPRGETDATPDGSNVGSEYGGSEPELG